MKVVFLLTLFLLFISFISATCEEGQIDINTASAEELDNIIWVGNATAQKIIALRPFNSVDELNKVSGIGDIKLANITSQGLACVAEEKTIGEAEEIINNETNIDNESSIKEIVEIKTSPKETELKTITLSPKAIKSNENSSVLNKSNYAIYGLFAFAILLILLFLIKRLIKRKKEKNELA